MRTMALLALILAGCDDKSGRDSGDPCGALADTGSAGLCEQGYDDGCRDGTDIGYVNGLSHGEVCLEYDDDPGERYSDTGDPYELGYNEGYLECYPDGYSEGYADGATEAGCP